MDFFWYRRNQRLGQPLCERDCEQHELDHYEELPTLTPSYIAATSDKKSSEVDASKRLASATSPNHYEALEYVNPNFQASDDDNPPAHDDEVHGDESPDTHNDNTTAEDESEEKVDLSNL